MDEGTAVTSLIGPEVIPITFKTDTRAQVNCTPDKRYTKSLRHFNDYELSWLRLLMEMKTPSRI